MNQLLFILHQQGKLPISLAGGQKQLGTPYIKLYGAFYKTKALKENPEAKWKFRHVKTLVVDECSMVAVSTFSTLLTTLLENAKLRKIVLLGDVRQLPSIEPGNFLADVYKTLIPVDALMELMTNHRAESNLIFNNATAISLNQYPLFSTEHKFVLHEVVQSEDTDMHDVGMYHCLSF